MSMETTDGNKAWLPEESFRLIVQPLFSQSVAFAVSNVIRTRAETFRIPLVTADPTAAWVEEAAEITASDATLSEVVVTPPKVAGLTVVSRELAEDSNPAAAEAVGAGLSRDIGRKVDTAFFSSVAAPAPDGLADLAGRVTLTNAAAFASTDVFAEALSIVEGQEADIGAWVASPSAALTLATAKTSDGMSANVNLFGPDPTQPTARQILGRPVLVSPYVAADHVFGIPAGHCHVVVREQVRLERDASAFFTSDQIAIKATARIGFGFTYPGAVIEIATS